MKTPISIVLTLFLLNSIVAEESAHNYLKPTEKNVVYGMDHGSALLLDVYQPENANGYGVVFIMGTGFTAYGEYDDVPLKHLDVTLHLNKVFPNFMGETYQLFKPMYDKGFTIFSINHRLAPKFKLPDQIRDAQRAVQFIRYHAEDYGIDPKKIGGMGHSSGATMIAFLGMLDDIADSDSYDPVHRESSRLQAVVPISGLHDFHRAATKDTRGTGAFLGTIVGRTISWQPEGHPVYEAYKGASVIEHVTADDARMLIMHGTEDSAVPIWHSEALAAALSEASVAHEYIALKGATHGSLVEPIDLVPCDYAAEWMEQALAQAN